MTRFISVVMSGGCTKSSKNGSSRTVSTRFGTSVLSRSFFVISIGGSRSPASANRFPTSNGVITPSSYTLIILPSLQCGGCCDNLSIVLAIVSALVIEFCVLISFGYVISFVRVFLGDRIGEYTCLGLSMQRFRPNVSRSIIASQAAFVHE